MDIYTHTHAANTAIFSQGTERTRLQVMRSARLTSESTCSETSTSGTHEVTTATHVFTWHESDQGRASTTSNKVARAHTDTHRHAPPSRTDTASSRRAPATASTRRWPQVQYAASRAAPEGARSPIPDPGTDPFPRCSVGRSAADEDRKPRPRSSTRRLLRATPTSATPAGVDSPAASARRTFFTIVVESRRARGARSAQRASRCSSCFQQPAQRSAACRACIRMPPTAQREHSCSRCTVMAGERGEAHRRHGR